MEDLAKADFRTIKTFITNNITAERLLVDILHQSVNEKPAQSSAQKSSTINFGEGENDDGLSEQGKRVITEKHSSETSTVNSK